MALKVVQLAAQLLENGFDNFAEREQPTTTTTRKLTVANATRGCGELFQLIVERRRRTV